MKPRTCSSPGFTLIELLVSITIIAVLSGLVMTMARYISDRGKAVECVNHMKELGTAALLFAGDNDMTLPVTSHQRRQRKKSWTLTLQEYAGGKIHYRCPCDEHLNRPYSYVLNDFLTPNPSGAPDLDFSRLSRLEKPSQTMLFAEARETYIFSDHFHFSDHRGRYLPFAVFAGQVAIKRHRDSSNFVFADGHVETLTVEQVEERLSRSDDHFVDPTEKSGSEG